MKMLNKLIGIFVILIITCNCLYGQIDTTICINFNGIEESVSRKNIVSIELLHILIPLIDGDYGFGFNYERLIKNNNAIVFTLTGMRRTSMTSDPSDIYYYYYSKIGYRRYLSKKVELSTSVINGEKYYLSKSKKTPQGLFYGGQLSIDGQINDYSNNEPWRNSPDFYHYDLGIGCNIGYQLLLKNKYILNIELPISFGVHYTYDKDLQGEIQNKDSEFGVFPMINMNLGYAF